MKKPRLRIFNWRLDRRSPAQLGAERALEQARADRALELEYERRVAENIRQRELARLRRPRLSLLTRQAS